MAKKVTAITGGICSGKSTVAGFLRAVGHTVIDCDVLARNITQTPEVMEEIAVKFGEKFFTNGELDRRMLAEFVFADETQTQLLNKITHPKILQLLKEKLDGLDGDVFVEVTLIDNPGLADVFDEVWVVVADEKERLSRLIKRNNFTLQQAKNIISRQPNYEEYLRMEQYGIKVLRVSNDFDLQALEKKVKRLLKANKGKTSNGN